MSLEILGVEEEHYHQIGKVELLINFDETLPVNDGFDFINSCRVLVIIKIVFP